MIRAWKRSLGTIIVGAILSVSLVGAVPVRAVLPAIQVILPADTLTGMIGAQFVFNQAVTTWRFTAQLGRPGDYPTESSIKGGTNPLAGTATIHFDTAGYKDGVWTLRAEHKDGVNWIVDDVHIVTMDNRPGVPLTQPGTATGTIKVVPAATGTVGVEVNVDQSTVEWELSKQAAADTGTSRWSRLDGNALRQYTYHWYTRAVSNGRYILRLQTFDANRHSQYQDVTITIDNRFGLPQTEPGTASAALDLPNIVSNVLPINLNFRGTVRNWRLQSMNINQANPAFSSIAAGQAGSAVAVSWNTAGVGDGTYMLQLEVEDENRHISQTTATTTVANKVTTTLQQPMLANEEHQYIVTGIGGLTSFRFGATPVGYYQLTIQTVDGKPIASQRVHPLSLPLQFDLPGGKYLVSVKALFVLPGSKYTVEMQGATAYTIPISKMNTTLPLAMRQVSSIPALVATGSPKPAAAVWYVDGGAPTTITKPDGTADIDTRQLGEGRHVVSLRASNPVGFTTLADFPFVVDNQQSFLDVPDTHAARWAVELLKDRQITNGYADGTFRPTATITRAEFAKMLSLAAGLDVSKPYSGVFADVKDSDWSAPYVEAVYSSGLVKGYTTADGLVFRPGAPVNRAELAVMLLRAADVPELLASIGTLSLTSPDWSTVKDWARPSIYVAVKAGLLSERYARRLEPDSPAERGEVALALGKVLLGGQLNRPAAP